ncbi:MAG: tRNA glutamyl-Q(34) synthetase GluQRS, partial [Proteobacteria bacterium]|nr:tRNA glutamyl-Q(34) synthetase GluQRS [Pseudomonadota bacterium]
MPSRASASPRAHTRYRGRFAPSPTGDLHMGSLVAAVASYLEARVRDGEWMLRVEDIDPPREVPGSADRILHALETFGFEWDGDVLYQSTRTDAYAEAVHKLREDGMGFGCACSRSDVAENAKHVGPEGPVYSGTCRTGAPAGRRERSVRLKVADAEICFDDRLQGRTCQNIAKDIGDFVIRRADGCYAYQLAVVVDDAAQGITDVVRGADLLLSTPRQIWLQHRLGLPSPGYLHIPLLLDESGNKLSKQNRSLPIDLRRPGSGLFDALCLLQQSPPTE